MKLTSTSHGGAIDRDMPTSSRRPAPAGTTAGSDDLIDALLSEGQTIALTALLSSPGPFHPYAPLAHKITSLCC